MKGHGGIRKGAGRPGRVPFFNMVSSDERRKYVEFVLSTYMESPDLTKWLGNQLFGQAPQSLDLTSGGKSVLPLLDRAIPKNNSSQQDKSAE